MSEHWEFFMCRMGDGIGTVLYDHGLNETIDGQPINQSVRIKYSFTNPDSEGLLGDDESSIAEQIESFLEIEIKNRSGIYTGRITFEGRRIFYCFLEATDDQMQEIISILESKFDYKFEYDTRDDPEKQDYWRDLFPTPETWQFIQNSKVVQVLESTGDDLSEPRRIDHWASFRLKTPRTRFAKWLQNERFQIEKEPKAKSKDGTYIIQFYREDIPEISKITEITVAISSKATELEGKYEGWESWVANGESSR